MSGPICNSELIFRTTITEGGSRRQNCFVDVREKTLNPKRKLRGEENEWCFSSSSSFSTSFVDPQLWWNQFSMSIFFSIRWLLWFVVSPHPYLLSILLCSFLIGSRTMMCKFLIRQIRNLYSVFLWHKYSLYIE